MSVKRISPNLIYFFAPSASLVRLVFPPRVFFARAKLAQIFKVINSIAMPIRPGKLNRVSADHRDIAHGFEFANCAADGFGRIARLAHAFDPGPAFGTGTRAAQVRESVNAFVSIRPIDLNQFVFDVDQNFLRLERWAGHFKFELSTGCVSRRRDHNMRARGRSNIWAKWRDRYFVRARRAMR